MDLVDSTKDVASGPIVGIDLGTTNSVVAALVNGEVRVLKGAGEAILPSVVGFDANDNLIVGIAARNQLAAFPDRTVASIKREMGTMQPVMLGNQSFTPPEISAIILRRLRELATQELGEPVSRAVITVPAFFDENQRQATREAGELAGFRVDRIINEPTAAALVYHAGDDDLKNLVVYDFGGGTFDVSVVRMEQGVVEVLSSKGDTRLGGDDLDVILMNHVADKFQKDFGVDLRHDAVSRFRLLRACEAAKCTLSHETVAKLSEEYIAEKDGETLHLVMEVKRSTYEELIEHLIGKTISCVDAALRDAGLTIDQIDEILLVGGSTRIPMVMQRLRDEFQQTPSRKVDPDLAVALGAATQAAMLGGAKVGPVLIDVTGHTLGIEVARDYMPFGMNLEFAPVIHRNSPLPASHEETFYKMSDSQKVVKICVYQGESSDLARNTLIGEFDIDLEEGGGDRSEIVVRFDLTLDGTLKVTCMQPATGIRKELDINNALSQFQSEQRDQAQLRLGQMFVSSEEGSDESLVGRRWKTHDKEASVAQPHGLGDTEQRYPAAMALIRRTKEIQRDVPAEDRAEIEDLAGRLAEAVVAGDDRTIEALSESLDDILFYVK